MKFPLLAKVGAIALVGLMLVRVLARIEGLVGERKGRGEEAVRSVERSHAAAQSILGPLLQRDCTEEWDVAVAASMCAVGFGLGIALLYGLLCALLQMEQNALVIGSVMLFAALATAMLLTRRIDWYALFARLRTASGEHARRDAAAAPDLRG